MMQRLAESGIDFGLFLTGLADMLRAQLAVTLGSSSVEVSERARAVLQQRTDRLSAADLLRMLAAIGELEPRFRKSGQQQLLLETLMIRFALRDRTVAIEDVLREMGDGGNAGSRSPGPSSSGGSRSVSGAGSVAGDTARRATSDTHSVAADRAVPQPPVARDQFSRPRGEAVPRPQGGAQSLPTGGGSATAVAAPPVARPAPAVGTVPSINVLSERWDDVVATLGSTRMLLAPFLEQAVPSAMSATGVLTVRADDEAAADALEMAKADMLAVVRVLFPAVERIVITRPNGPSVSGSHRRVTEEEIREQRITSLRKRDPVLGAAIDALDLELLD